MPALRAARPETVAGGLLLALTLLVCGTAAAQSGSLAAPCVYRDAGGRTVITDQPSDPSCARPAAGARIVRPPGRLPVTFAITELVAMAHDAAERHGVDHRLVESLVEMESGFNPAARSAKGAMGLMQLMPAVAARYRVVDPYDPFDNLDGGVRHLRDLLDHFGPDLQRAVAAYNAGIGAVERYGGIPPYAETRTYVSRVLYRYRQRVGGLPLH